jgi:ketosteroid isomerase-like protein
MGVTVESITRRGLLQLGSAAAVYAATADLATSIPVVAAPAGGQGGTSMNNAVPPEIQSLIENHIKAFNTHDTALFYSLFSDSAIVVDGIPPYRWLSPNAPAQWMAEVERWHKKFEVTHEHLDYEMGISLVEEQYGYACVLGSLSITFKGQTVIRKGTLTYTFSKHGDAWKIEAQAWGRTT